MAFIRERRLAANGMDFFIAEAGEPGAPLVLCLHGFPECWASWRYQLPALAQSGYHAVAPDLRGYGETGGPAEVGAYRQSRLVADVVAAAGYYRDRLGFAFERFWGEPPCFCMPHRDGHIVMLSQVEE